MRRNQPVEVPAVHCPECSRPMQIRTGTTGVFLGCSGYNLPPKERCKGTLNLTPVESLAALSDDDSAETADLMSKHRCPKCGTAMDSYVIDGGRKLHVCGNNRIAMAMSLKKASSRSKVMMAQPFHVINVMVKCSLKLAVLVRISLVQAVTILVKS